MNAGIRIFFWAMIGIVVGLVIYSIYAAFAGDPVANLSVPPFMVIGGLVGTLIGILQVRKRRPR